MKTCTADDWTRAVIQTRRLTSHGLSPHLKPTLTIYATQLKAMSGSFSILSHAQLTPNVWQTRTRRARPMWQSSGRVPQIFTSHQSGNRYSSTRLQMRNKSAPRLPCPSALPRVAAAASGGHPNMCPERFEGLTAAPRPPPCSPNVVSNRLVTVCSSLT